MVVSQTTSRSAVKRIFPKQNKTFYKSLSIFLPIPKGKRQIDFMGIAEIQEFGRQIVIEPIAQANGFGFIEVDAGVRATLLEV